MNDKRSILKVNQEVNEISISGLVLSKERIERLKKYYLHVCDKLEWIETDPNKLEYLISKFIKTNYVHNENCMEVLSKVILTYYTLRKELSNNVSDDDIIESIVFTYVSIYGMGIETLLKRTIEYWRSKGVEINEWY